MLASLVPFVIILLAKNSVCDENSTISSTTIAPQPPETKLLCKTCECTETRVNCTGRGLEIHFHDGEWPTYALEEVTFTGNFLIHLKPFPNVTIKHLILRGNRITKIDDKAFRDIKNLTELDLSHNQLTSELFKPSIFEGNFSPNGYEPLEQLRTLNLGNNALHTLKQDVFEHVADLRVLILSGNPLTTIDQGTTNAISQLLYLEELDLSDCDLTTLPDHLFHAPSHLKRLHLNDNRITIPPSALEDCKSLEYLSLDRNPFKSLNSTALFPLMPVLKELSLDSLPHLKIIGHGAFSNLKALERLTVKNCPKLVEIESDALVKRGSDGSIWPPLKSLDISNNALRYLPAGLVGRWDLLDKLNLINNEWSCDCENEYLIGNLLPDEGKRLMAKDIERLKCSAPPEHAGKNLSSLASHKLRCLDLYEARPERDAAMLVGVLIGLLLAIPIALMTFLFWRKGFFFCGAQGPASFSRAFYKRTSNDDNI